MAEVVVQQRGVGRGGWFRGDPRPPVRTPIRLREQVPPHVFHHGDRHNANLDWNSIVAALQDRPGIWYSVPGLHSVNVTKNLRHAKLGGAAQESVPGHVEVEFVRVDLATQRRVRIWVRWMND